MRRPIRTRGHAHDGRPTLTSGGPVLAAALMLAATLTGMTTGLAQDAPPADVPGHAPLDVPALVAAAPPAGEFPGEDVVVLYRAETVTVDDDGRVTRRVHTIRRLQTQWAMRRESDVRVAWDRDRQDLEVLTARTFMRDGTVVPTPDNGTNEVTPDAVAHAAPFLNWRELVISHVGTEPGCVVELEYELRDREAPTIPPSGACWLVGDDPVLQAVVVVQGARAVLAAADGHDVTTAAPGHWQARDLAPVRDPGVARWRARVAPHVAWSTTGGPGTLARTLRWPGDAAATPDSAVAALVSRLGDDPDVLTRADAHARLAAHVAGAIATVELPGGPWCAPPRPAAEVAATAVGTAWEKALLLMACLRAADLQPELGLFGRDVSAGTDGPVVADRFTCLRVVVRDGDRNWWFAPDESEPWTHGSDLPGWTGLFLATDGGHRLYTAPLREGRTIWRAHLAPADDAAGWTATADLELAGPWHDPAVGAQDLATTLASRLLPDGELAAVEVREQTDGVLALRVTAVGESPGESLGGLTVRELPLPASGLLAHLPPGLDGQHPRRAQPLWIESPGREEWIVTIDLPAGLALDAPRPAEIHTTWPGGSLTRRCAVEGSRITLQAVLELAAGPVAPEDFPRLLSGVQEARRWRGQTLVLREAAPGPGGR
jgi:hypothetical protein